MYFCFLQIYYIVQAIVRFDSADVSMTHYEILLSILSKTELIFLLMFCFQTGNNMESQRKKLVQKIVSSKVGFDTVVLTNDETLNFKFNFCDMDYRYLCMIYSAALNYVIVLIQFDFEI